MRIHKNADIRQETDNGVCYVYVIGRNGKECFRREKSKQAIAIAHAIYMYEKYDKTEEIQTLNITAWAAHILPIEVVRKSI